MSKSISQRSRALLRCSLFAAFLPLGACVTSSPASLSDAEGASLEGSPVLGSEERAARVTLGVNDVSYVFPLPEPEHEDSLLGLDAAGSHGTLMPRAIFDEKVGRLWEGGAAASYGWSRIIALRLDPCAGQTVVTDPSSCRSEVRLSAQPVTSADTTSTIDGTLHLVYQVPRPTLDAMLSDLLALKATSGLDVSSMPLGRHPIMVEQGLDGPFARGVKETILEYVGADNLVKFTFVRVGRSADDWTFQQLEKVNGTFVDAQIPASVPEGTDPETIAGAREQFVSELEDIGARETGISPHDDSVGYPRNLWSSVAARALPAPELEASLRRLASFEDPAEFSSHNLDCASCHLVNARTFYEELTGIEVPQSFVPPPGQNTSRHDETELGGRVVRALGYRGARLAVSQRAINESARVADWLSHGIR